MSRVLIADDVAGFVELADLAVVQVDDLVGEAGESPGIGGEVMAILAEPDNERAAQRAPTMTPGSCRDITARP